MSKSTINWSDHLLNFVSVILGVSLAFFVSSQSELAKQEAEFLQSVQAMLVEVEDDIASFDGYQIPDNREKLANMQKAFAMINKGVADDSLAIYMMSFFDINNYSPATTTLSSLVSSGKLDVINDFELKNRLLGYKDFATELKAQGDFQVDYLMDRIVPWFISHPELLSPDFYQGQKLNATIVSEARVVLSLYISFVGGKLSKYEKASEMAKELKRSLESYNAN